MGNRAKLPGMDDLERLREEIGALDRTVLETLNQRLELVKRVNQHKQATGAPLIDAAREAELLRELAEANTGPLSERAVQGVFAEPASAASVAGALKYGAAGGLRPGSVVVCTLTGHGLKDPDTALKNLSNTIVVEPDVGKVLKILKGG